MPNPTHLLDPSVRILTDPDTPRSDWLALRREGIGGSDALAVAGLDKNRSPLAVWLDKTGRIDDEFDNPIMRWGRMLEPVLRNWFEETTGIKVYQCGMLGHPDRPWQLFTPDGLCDDGALLEIKTVSPFGQVAAQWEGGVADRAAIQLHHGMSVTGKRKGYAVAGIWGRDPIIREVHYDPDLDANLIALEQEFWDYVTSDVAPPLTGHQQEGELMRLLHPVATDDTVELSLKGYQALVNYQVIGRQMDTLKARRDACQAAVLRELGDAGEGTWGGRTVVTFRNTGTLSYKALAAKDQPLAFQYSRTELVLDTKRLFEEHPETGTLRPRRFTTHL
jgi:putative phage-type endonuclease